MVNIHWKDGTIGTTCLADISCRNDQTAHVEYNAILLGQGDRITKWQQAWASLNGKPKDPRSAHKINDTVIEGVQNGWAVKEIITRVVTAGLTGGS